MSLDRSIICATLTALSLVALPVSAAEEPATPTAPAAEDTVTAPAADAAAKEPEADAKTDDAKTDDAKTDDAKADTAKDAEPKAAEGDSKDADTAEGDAKQPEAAEGDAKDADTAEGDAKQPEAAEGYVKEPEQKAAEDAEPAKTYVTGDVVFGDPNAPVTVIEYASFTCPHCASFHVQTWPEVKKNYVDTGKVNFIMREVYFDEYGLWAGMVARCGGEAGYYPIVDTLLGDQQSWTRSSDIVTSIIQIGRRAGLSKAQIEGCLTDRDYAKTLIEAYQTNAAADNVQSTPSFVIGGETVSGAMSFEDFSKLLDAALADG